jgi:hypothetical protein
LGRVVVDNDPCTEAGFVGDDAFATTYGVHVEVHAPVH